MAAVNYNPAGGWRILPIDNPAVPLSSCDAMLTRRALLMSMPMPMGMGMRVGVVRAIGR
jgi:hypothetical protein